MRACREGEALCGRTALHTHSQTGAEGMGRECAEAGRGPRRGQHALGQGNCRDGEMRSELGLTACYLRSGLNPLNGVDERTHTNLLDQRQVYCDFRCQCADKV